MKARLQLFIAILFIGCEKELPSAQDFPIITTLEPEEIDETGATFRGELIQPGKNEMTSYGFVWDITEPNLATSNKVLIGSSIDRGIFEQRIDYSLAGGTKYNIRSFATFSDRTVYGNTTTFKSKGSSRSGWSLEQEDISLPGYFESYGSANNRNGYVKFQSSEFYSFNPIEKKFTLANTFPVGGNSGTQFTVITNGEVQYYFSNINRTLYKLENDSWSVESGVPFAYGNFSGYYHGHSSDGKLYILSSYVSYMYDPQTSTWESKGKLPTNVGYSIGGASLGNKSYVLTTDKRLWEYDHVTDNWVVRKSYPGVLNKRIISFSYGNKVHFGLSFKGQSTTGWMDKKLWSYDPALDRWEQHDDLFPMDLGSHDLFYFYLKDRLYLGHGFQKYNLWVMDPSKL